MKRPIRPRALVVAALTCPCHVVLLPLLAGGTAFGAALEARLGWLAAGATLVFLSALWIVIRKPREPAGAFYEGGRCGDEESPGRSPKGPHLHETEEAWQAAAPR